MKNIAKRKEAQRIAERTSSRKMNPLEARAALDTLMEGLASSVWNPGQNQFKIFGAQGVDARIYLDGLDRGKMAELAALCYHQAQLNGSLDPGEVHIDSKTSSKHHKEGFVKYLNGLFSKYTASVAGA